MEEQPSGSLAYRRVIWISFVIALVVYGVIGVFILSPPREGANLPIWLLPLIAVGAGVGSLLIPRIMKDAPVTNDKPALRKPELIGWVWADGIGIIGLVAFFLGTVSPQGLIVYQAAGLALLIIQRPTD